MTEPVASAGSSCPDLDDLEASPLTASVLQHVACCFACRIVVDVFEQRADLDECPRFDALLAARRDGTLNSAGKNLLDRHLASCASCRFVAETLSPTQDAFGDHATLPKVDPAWYELGLEVGRGGMGRVIAARDLRVGRPIAVKELLGRSPQLAARFEREARVTARLQHPGIVPIYEIGRWPDGTPFYTMRMVDGGTLRTAIERATGLPARLALLPAVIAASEAIAFAHGQRVIHRDLTPSNILVGAYGETVVIDWGLAKDLSQGIVGDEPPADPYRTSAATPDGLTNAGAVIGTLAYMPPEQANATDVDERADVYALGAILYHLLAGAPAYRASSVDELLEAIKAGGPPSIDRVAPTTPRDLVSIVTKAMARDPEARYPSARELADELKRFQTGRMVEAHSYSRYELVRRFVKRNRGAVTVAALATVVLGSAGAAAIERIVRSGAEARETVLELTLEKGRVELLAGNGLRALAYLHEANERGARGPMLDFLLRSALLGLGDSERTLDCGAQVRHVEFAPLDPATPATSARPATMAVACHDLAKVWRVADGTLVASLGVGGSASGEALLYPGGFDMLAYSHDGETLATWGQEGVARLWDARTGALKTTYKHGARITFTTFTPNDDRIATAGDDGFVRIWDASTPTPLRAIEAAAIGPRSVYGVLSKDGTRVYTMTLLGRGRAWSVETGEELGSFDHGGVVFGGQASPDGKHVLSCGLDGTTRLWDVTTGTLQFTLSGHTSLVVKCVFSSDSALALTTGYDGMAKVWDVATGRLITPVSHGDIVVNGSFAADTARFVTIGIGGGIKIWDTRSGALLASHDAVRGSDAQFSPDGQHLVGLRGDFRVQVWGTTSSRIGSVRAAAGASVLGVTDDGRGVMVTAGGSVNLRDPTAPAYQISGLWPPIATSTQRIAALNATGVVVHDPTTRTTFALPLAVSPAPSALHLSGDGRRLAVMREPGAPEIWDVETATRLAALDGATHALLSHDGRRAVGWRGPGSPAVIWDLDDPARRVTIPSAGRPVGFSRDGTRLALVQHGPTGEVSLWNASWGTPVFVQRDVNVVPSFDPTGRWLTTIGSIDRVVTVRDTRDGTIESSFVGEQLLAAQVNGDASLVVGIGDYGRTVLVMSAIDGRILARWPIEQANPVVTETGFAPPSASAWWTPDSTGIVSRATSVTLWSASSAPSTDELRQRVRKNVRWNVVNGQLQLIQNARLSGRVTRKGEPIRDAVVRIDIRTSSDVGTSAINWQTMKAKFSRVEQSPAANGSFVFEDLVFGEYALSVTASGVTKTFDVHVGPDENPLELEVDPVH